MLIALPPLRILRVLCVEGSQVRAAAPNSAVLSPCKRYPTIRAVTRTIILWAAVLAAGAFALQWLEYQYVVRVFSREITIGLIGTACAAGGVWAGWKLTTRNAPAPFARNAAAQSSLGLTGQEMRVLERLAAGESNKDIARTLGLSPHTVKTHTANLYAKLEVGSRGQAVSKARSLHLLP